MNNRERDELLKLIRARERVMKTAASQRSAAMLAEFERQISALHHWDNDEQWAALKQEADMMIADIQKRLAARCEELGIPEEFQPSLSLGWSHRGYNGVKDRRDELRRVAKAEIDQVETKARAEIELMSVNAQTEIISSGLESVAAKAFLAALPLVATLMPMLNPEQIASRVDEKRARRLN